MIGEDSDRHGTEKGETRPSVAQRGSTAAQECERSSKKQEEARRRRRERGSNSAEGVGWGKRNRKEKREKRKEKKRKREIARATFLFWESEKRERATLSKGADDSAKKNSRTMLT
jgi:hypothetical protein